MNNSIFPAAICLPTTSPRNAVVRIPGSKSITNRALILAALSRGETTLLNVLDADDTRRMIDCLKALGVAISSVPFLDGLRVSGTGGKIAPASLSGETIELFCGNSGTTIRFVSAIAPLAPTGVSIMLDGIERMRQRPIEDLIEAMRALGADAVCVNSNGCPPVIVRGGGFNGGSCRIKGTLSSQYLSAILMAAPFAKDGAKIEVEGDLVSKPYVDMTRSMMAQFGLSSEKDAYSTLHVRPATQESGSRNYSIEPDASGATYFLAAAAVLGSAVTIEGLGKNSLQGDAKFVEVLEKMGCIVEQSETQTSVTGSEHKLRALNYDFEAMPDTAQTAAALAIFADGTSTLTGLRTLRVKETDRIAAMKTELEKLGAIVAATDDSLTITPPKSLPADYSQPIGIETYDDHRMAMAMAVAGLKTPLIIQNAECVNKTFPTFWDLWIGNTKMQK